MRVCCLCDGEENVLKRRVQVLPSLYKCIHICRGCLPRMNEAITAVREILV